MPGRISNIIMRDKAKPAKAGSKYLFSHFRLGLLFNFTIYGTPVLASTPANTARKTIQLNISLPFSTY
ncbi:MAG: hypothetical protein PHD13_06100 [Methanocellales archaeon]|nr:hypothetical protein [Methanocellales archaeon]MDD3292205.1 hypothetical protein [Methanocellales archaeon]MDD5235728.1 hypothetical protein [Methanocellales archaeon]MDD5485793.1 hypothetical protein [Methanocellales archaeon]